jgi:hypothetical protein
VLSDNARLFIGMPKLKLAILEIDFSKAVQTVKLLQRARGQRELTVPNDHYE